MPEPVCGLVLRLDAKLCHVELGGRTLVLPLRGRLFEDRGHEGRPIAVGDRVLVLIEGEGGVIEQILPRQTKLSRSRGEQQAEQVIAANVTLALVTAGVDAPRFQPDLVDRLLAGAASAEIQPALAITKIDRDRKGEAARWAQLYRGLGYPVFETSVAPGAVTVGSLAALRELLRAHVTVLCGVSGAGKSSLINALCPELNLRIGSLSQSRLGRHTTTHVQLVPLPGGGHVLDTPGMRGFTLFAVDPQEVQFLFPEIKVWVGQCRYPNCRHGVEPECAVLAALAATKIAESRYASYRAIVDELAVR